VCAFVQTVQKLKFENFPPDLAPLDYHIFGPIKDALHGGQFKSSEVVMGVANTWHILRNQKHSLHVASESSWAGVTNMKRKCEITLKKGSEFVPVCHLWKRTNQIAQILFYTLIHL
jgi:hypothetical protein